MPSKSKVVPARRSSAASLKSSMKAPNKASAATTGSQTTRAYLKRRDLLLGAVSFNSKSSTVGATPGTSAAGNSAPVEQEEDPEVVHMILPAKTSKAPPVYRARHDGSVVGALCPPELREGLGKLLASSEGNPLFIKKEPEIEGQSSSKVHLVQECCMYYYNQAKEAQEQEQRAVQRYNTHRSLYDEAVQIVNKLRGELRKSKTQLLALKLGNEAIKAKLGKLEEQAVQQSETTTSHPGTVEPREINNNDVKEPNIQQEKRKKKRREDKEDSMTTDEEDADYVDEQEQANISTTAPAAANDEQVADLGEAGGSKKEDSVASLRHKLEIAKYELKIMKLRHPSGEESATANEVVDDDVPDNDEPKDIHGLRRRLLEVKRTMEAGRLQIRLLSNENARLKSSDRAAAELKDRIEFHEENREWILDLTESFTGLLSNLATDFRTVTTKYVKYIDETENLRIGLDDRNAGDDTTESANASTAKTNEEDEEEEEDEDELQDDVSENSEKKKKKRIRCTGTEDCPNGAAHKGRFHCDTCDKFICDKEKLESHISHMHKGQLMFCPAEECAYKSRIMTNMKNHHRRVHKKELQIHKQQDVNGNQDEDQAI